MLFLYDIIMDAYVLKYLNYITAIYRRLECEAIHLQHHFKESNLLRF